MLFPPWLWRELQRHTDATTSSVNVKLDMLRAAVRQKLWEQYSERPETGTPSSMAFGHLESLLSRAPSYADKIQSLDMEFFDSGGIERYEWSREFKDRVNSAVDAVRVQHGEPGKMLALWLLYHTVGSFVLNVLPSRDSKLVFKLLIVRPLHSMPRYAFHSQDCRVGRRGCEGL